jgi:antitoxin ParD1/3/4
MPTRNVVLSEQQEALISDLIQSGEFLDAGEVVREGIRLVAASRLSDKAKEEEMRKAIRVGLDELNEGRFTSLSGPDELAAHLRVLGERAAAQVAQEHSQG